MLNNARFTFLAETMKDVKHEKTSTNLDRVRTILNNAFTIPCINMVINESTTTDMYYGMIVFPKIELDKEKGLNIKSYVIEIQKQLLDILDGYELAAMIIHDISHNILSYMAINRFKEAVYQSCKMTDMKVIDVMYNIDNKIRDLAMLDICNRTFKNPIVEGTEILEPDRLLTDISVADHFNSAIKKIADCVEGFDLSNPEDQHIADMFMAGKVIKMVREKAKGIKREYNWLKKYITDTYATKVFGMYPSFDVQMKDELFGEQVSKIETLKPYELSMLQESSMTYLKAKMIGYNTSLITESVFSQSRPNTTALHKELDIIKFKMQSMSSNYERLDLLDRIYDSIYMIERYLDSKPDDVTIQGYLEKFSELPNLLEAMKPTKKRYGVFVEYPPGYTEE